MAFDLGKFGVAPQEFEVEHEGEVLKFQVQPVSVKDFAKEFQSSSRDMYTNMRKTFLKLLRDENGEPLKAEWVDQLLTQENLIPLALKVNDALNTKLGLNDLAGKKA